jgi:hypothetical protein
VPLVACAAIANHAIFFHRSGSEECSNSFRLSSLRSIGVHSVIDGDTWWSPWVCSGRSI